MDISINLEGYKLNVRSAGVIIHNNKLLVHHDLNLRTLCVNRRKNSYWRDFGRDNKKRNKRRDRQGY